MFNPSGLYELIETLWQRGQWIGFVIGLVVGGGAGAWGCKQLLPSHWKDKFDTIKERNDELVRAKEALDLRLDAETQHRESVQQLNDRYAVQTESGEANAARLAEERDRLQRAAALGADRLSQAEAKLIEAESGRKEVEAKFTKWLRSSVQKRWEQPVREPSVRFRSLHARQTPIISVVNLKGGVGKTTITANLGATLSQRGLRVLLIDLDYQGSLSSLCLSPQELQEVRTSRRLVQDVLRNGVEDRTKAVFQCATRLEDLGVGAAYLLATEDELDDVESQVMAHWLLSVSGDDVRFRLRSALHAPAIQEEYDVILIDCPPRLSTGCVNALAASDFALIPVLLEPTSAEAAPRLLRWLKKFQATFSPELAVLGVVANRVRYHGKPIAKQQQLWARLKDQCHDAWGAEVRFFDEAMIRQFPNLTHRLAALCPGQNAVMNDLADVIWKELPPYARRRVAGVPPVAHPPAPGVRS